MKRLLVFDGEGFYDEEKDIVADDYKASVNEYLAELDEEIAFHRPKLVDGQIVEGKTEEEFLEEEYLASLVPSQEELDEADFIIKILTLLTELEMI